MKIATLTLGLLICLFSAAAGAQEITKPSCKQPPMPSDQSSDMVVKYFNKHRIEYDKCMNKFVDEQKAIVAANEKTDPAKAKQAYDSAEAALKELNAFIDALNEHSKTQDDK